MEASHGIQSTLSNEFSFFRPPSSAFSSVSNYSELNPSVERGKTEERRRKILDGSISWNSINSRNEFSFFRPPSSAFSSVSNYSELNPSVERGKTEERRRKILDGSISWNSINSHDEFSFFRPPSFRPSLPFPTIPN
jgi:hypothetical protein